MVHRFRVEWSFWLLLALLLMTLPLTWVMAAMLAAAFHELCHLVMLRCWRVPVYGIHIRAGGAGIDTGPLAHREELLCALAGPMGSFLLLLLLHIAPRTAVCGLMQGLYNLIPVGDLDGGRALRSAIRLIRGKSPCKRGKMRVQ